MTGFIALAYRAVTSPIAIVLAIDPRMAERKSQFHRSIILEVFQTDRRVLLKPTFYQGAARVLILDSDPSATTIAHVLEPPNYSAIVVSSREEAICRLEEEGPFEAFLTALSAHGPVEKAWSVEDTSRLIAQTGASQPQLPIIVVASADEVSAALLAMSAGAYDYLPRPVDAARLLTTIQGATGHFRLLEQNREYRQDLERVVSERTEMLRQAIANLEESYDITLEALGYALDLKDAGTEGHSKRVTAFTIALARSIELDHETVRMIARSAFLHDIGKIAIPDAILLKPGKLQSSEQGIMREHCWRGYEILHKIPFLEEVAEIVYSHQERYDGSGYPRGLKGEEIPLGARIFSIADTLDAITSDRPYRKAKGFPEARREIARCAGTQFDPKLVETYLRIPDSMWIELKWAVMQRTSGIG